VVVVVALPVVLVVVLLLAVVVVVVVVAMHGQKILKVDTVESPRCNITTVRSLIPLSHPYSSSIVVVVVVVVVASQTDQSITFFQERNFGFLGKCNN